MNPMYQTAGQLMTENPITIEETQSLRVAAKLMIDRHIHALVALRKDNRAAGVVTLKDVVQTLATGDPLVLDSLLVADAMTSPAITVRSEMLVIDCLALMRMTGVRMAPVTLHGDYVGVLSYTDIVRAAVSWSGDNND